MPNPFVRPAKRPQCKGTDFVPIDKNFIVEFDVKDKVIKTGEGEFDYVLKQVVFPKSKVLRSDAINEHRDDVGILNVMKTVAKTGDISPFTHNGEVLSSNLSILSEEEKLNAAIKAKETYSNLDPDLTKGKSFNDFTSKAMSSDEFDAYIQKKVEEKLAASQPKVEEVTNNG